MVKTKLEEVSEKLKAIRESKTLSLKPTPMLRQEIDGPDGKLQPFKLRYYQCQGIYHLLMMKRMILGDGTGLGKTIQVLGALCYLWPSEPNNKAMVFCPKSAIRQWAKEINKFTTGIETIIVTGTPGERKAAYEAFLNAPTGPDKPKVVLISNYHSLVRDWDVGAVIPKLPNGKLNPKLPMVPGLLDGITAGVSSLVVVFDEATAFKNPNTKTHQVCRFLSERAQRCYGLTATLLSNHLMEGFGIYKVIKPDLFSTKTKFMDDYCVTKLQSVPGGRKIPIVVGYKNLQKFREVIDPYFLGRSKHEVSKELPALTTREILCELSEAEDRKYAEALEGILELGDGTVKDFEETKALTSLIYCQQVANSTALIGFKEGDVLGNVIQDNEVKVKDRSSKEQALVELLSDEFDGEKVIVYTRFEKLVGRLQKILKAENIKSVRVTGKEKDIDRQKAMDSFQDSNSDVRVVFITDAGSEAINLQMANAMVFFDAPYSWGRYVQLLGRMIRIGSPHQSVFAIHLVAERYGATRKNRKTIDHHVLSLLQEKKALIDQIIGEAAVGALTFQKGDGGVKDLFKAVKQDAKSSV